MSVDHAFRPRAPWRATFVLLALSVAPAWADAIQVPAQDAYLFGAARVIDGDTLEIAGNSIRLADIDAPPLGYSCTMSQAGTAPCGQRAALYLKELVGLAPVTCIPSGRDSYTREVARCSVKGTDLGAAMVKAGWALARFDDTYAPEQTEAKTRRAGLWAFDDPLSFAPNRP